MVCVFNSLRSSKTAPRTFWLRSLCSLNQKLHVAVFFFLLRECFAFDCAHITTCKCSSDTKKGKKKEKEINMREGLQPSLLRGSQLRVTAKDVGTHFT